MAGASPLVEAQRRLYEEPQPDQKENSLQEERTQSTSKVSKGILCALNTGPTCASLLPRPKLVSTLD